MLTHDLRLGHIPSRMTGPTQPSYIQRETVVVVRALGLTDAATLLAGGGANQPACPKRLLNRADGTTNDRGSLGMIFDPLRRARCLRLRATRLISGIPLCPTLREHLAVSSVGRHTARPNPVSVLYVVKVVQVGDARLASRDMAGGAGFVPMKLGNRLRLATTGTAKSDILRLHRLPPVVGANPRPVCAGAGIRHVNFTT